ncbi:unnamed protein product [Vitrella brassicaformis CCMP3155]|uniref:Uncharacterized protein n=1 Tax=Vitrella brassicaformis (strain CCMP3155) TaxID=1169540 RepID=A0A0G4ERL8_VITBC|nr:unnamed protein product [Vitrella brassicaformis CCMP3155]|eukprot:CEL99933.1 unnamed protein product [Vitrella brassicaformis CCMP3155]
MHRIDTVVDCRVRDIGDFEGFWSLIEAAPHHSPAPRRPSGGPLSARPCHHQGGRHGHVTPPDRRATLRQCIDRLPQAEASTALTLVEQRIEEAVGRLGLEDALVFDVGGLEDGWKVVHLLEEGSGGEWRAMGRFIRLAAIYRLTPNATLPLRLSADALPSPTAFLQLPLAMAIYRLFGHRLTHQGTSLALQPADNDVHRIGDESFRVVPLSELPANHPYRSAYNTTDPAIRWGNWLLASFSSFLLGRLFMLWCHEAWVGNRRVLQAHIGRNDTRYRRLLTEAMSEQQQGAIAVDYRNDGGNLNYANPFHFRYVVVSGFRPNEDVAALLSVIGDITLWTTERSAGDRSQPLAVRFPTSMPRWRAVLSHFELADGVINRGTVV